MGNFSTTENTKLHRENKNVIKNGHRDRRKEIKSIFWHKGNFKKT
jgi:hypothetical protein